MGSVAGNGGGILAGGRLSPHILDQPPITFIASSSAELPARVPWEVDVADSTPIASLEANHLRTAAIGASGRYHF